MSESQPLLAGGQPQHDSEIPQDHPIFLRACHSPWNWLSQNVLCYVRGIVLAYVIAIAAMTTTYKLRRDDVHTEWRFIFQFSSITWALIVVYHVLVFCWTLTHLHWPDVDADDNSWEAKLLRLMQPPQQIGYSRRRFYFSLFYTLVHVYSFMLTFIFWIILVPNGHGHMPSSPPSPDRAHTATGDLAGEAVVQGWFKPFSVFHLYTFPSLLAFVEILFLNAIRRQVPVPSHIFAVQFLAALYLGWAAIGKMITGHSAFFWMDEQLAGAPEIVAAYCIGFIFLATVSFAFMYGLISMRDSIVERRAYPEDHAED